MISYHYCKYLRSFCCMNTFLIALIRDYNTGLIYKKTFNGMKISAETKENVQRRNTMCSKLEKSVYCRWGFRSEFIQLWFKCITTLWQCWPPPGIWGWSPPEEVSFVIWFLVYVQDLWQRYQNRLFMISLQSETKQQHVLEDTVSLWIRDEIQRECFVQKNDGKEFWIVLLHVLSPSTSRTLGWKGKNIMDILSKPAAQKIIFSGTPVFIFYILRWIISLLK